VAARTTRVRVGTSVVLLPLHHPVHVAEDVITLDLVSKGRVILGVGIGYQPADFRAFSVPMEIAPAASRKVSRSCACAGPARRSRSVASTMPSTISRSVRDHISDRDRIADGFVGTPSTSMANATHLADVYKKAAREAGRPAEVVQMRDAWVASSRREAEAVYGPHVMAAYRYYWENRLADSVMSPPARSSPCRISRPIA
jgi:alkanesulfonate monooxygenase SsuD/methylene tetrahydromethanopterin reductase-like flavin-dependent oxidoreductase (luciferase family)